MIHWSTHASSWMLEPVSVHGVVLDRQILQLSLGVA